MPSSLASFHGKHQTQLAVATLKLVATNPSFIEPLKLLAILVVGGWLQTVNEPHKVLAILVLVVATIY
jgi:hypothetical protein